MIPSMSEWFETIDCDDKAYIYGCIMASGTIYSDRIIIEMPSKNTLIRKIFKHLSTMDVQIMLANTHYGKNLLVIKNQLIAKIVNDKLDFCMKIPNLADNFKYSFIRGYFDQTGFINIHRPEVQFKCSVVKDKFKNMINIPFVETWDALNFVGINAIDFLGKMYSSHPNLCSNFKYSLYKRVLMWQPRHLPMFKYKVSNGGLAPKKAHPSDAGWDVHIVRKIKEENNIIYYGTGLQVQPDPTFYFDLVARSSLCKHGYMLANSIGIIDSSFTGEIMIPLIPIGTSQNELKLPFRVAQLIPRQVIHIIDQKVDKLDETSRSCGGFGSTCSV